MLVGVVEDGERLGMEKIEQFKTQLERYKIGVRPYYDDQLTHIIVANGTGRDAVERWLKGEKIGRKVNVVTPEWVCEYIRRQKGMRSEVHERDFLWKPEIVQELIIPKRKRSLKRKRDSSPLQEKADLLVAFLKLSNTKTKLFQTRFAQDLKVKTATEWSDKVTHIVVPNNTKWDDIDKWAKGSTIQDVEVVRDDWASKFLLTKTVPDANLFRWKSDEVNLKSGRKVEESFKNLPNPYRHDVESFIAQSKYLGMGCANTKGGDSQSTPEKPSQGHFNMDFISPNLVNPTPTISSLPHSQQSSQSSYQRKWNITEPTVATPQNHNSHITEKLEILYQYNKLLGAAPNAKERFKADTYRRLINFLKGLDHEILSEKELESVHGFGDHMLEYVREILRTGGLKKAENVKSEPFIRTVELLTSVYGVGPAKAASLYQRGIRTVEDMRTKLNPSELTHQVELGLKYFDDLQLKIPREEVAKIGDHIRAAAAKVYPKRKITVVEGGSYRRGMKECGDCDILITFPDHEQPESLSVLLSALSDENFLVGHLTNTWEKDEFEGKRQSYMGICRVPGERYHRRIDIKMYPRSVFAFALIYFTGNTEINRALRLNARVKGYSMSDIGIQKAIRNGKDLVVKGTENLFPHLKTERDIFEFLDFPYLEPHERNCSNQDMMKANAKLMKNLRK